MEDYTIAWACPKRQARIGSSEPEKYRIVVNHNRCSKCLSARRLGVIRPDDSPPIHRCRPGVLTTTPNTTTTSIAPNRKRDTAPCINRSLPEQQSENRHLHTDPEMTNTSIGHFRGGRGKPRISRTFNRLPRAVGSASVPAGDRAALVGSAKSGTTLSEMTDTFQLATPRSLPAVHLGMPF